MTEHDNWTALVRDGLRSEAYDAPAAPFDLSAVHGRATAIRRRRRIVTGFAAAAAVAVLVPAAVMLTPGGTQTMPPVAPSPTIVDPTIPTPEPTPEPGGSATWHSDLSDLPVGEAPQVPYARDSVVVFPDGAQVRPETRHEPYAVHYQAAADRYVVGTHDGAGGWYVEVIPGIGADRQVYDAEPGLVTNASQSTVAWLTPGGPVMALRIGEPEPVAFSNELPGADRRLVALEGEDCREVTVGHDCAAYVNVGDALWSSHLAGPTEPMSPATAIGAADMTMDGRIAVMRSRDDLEPGSCWAVLPRLWHDQEPIWESCDAGLEAFSPDGRHLRGVPAYRSGIGDGLVSILGAETGQVRVGLGRFDAEGEDWFIAGSVWEDSDHLLVLVATPLPDTWTEDKIEVDHRWQIIRLGLDGSVENAVEPVVGDELTPVFMLMGR
ncbi:hypothetical protein [Nocardioides limicola]|uniref:hypothetical protein n=1 Tax=Nocardioides limicola TaxID=2803368 RepID=UPI00193B98E2|nr:hypothetical protein [Nocardioides sp. DJM-14]